MLEIGYALSSEEHGPSELVHLTRRAEDVGFSFALISDHCHPWIDRQGHSPFAWSVLGGVAEATDRLHVGTGVTCPTMRYHPAMLAQMAATIGGMMPGRFFLGVGTGENLNEHILGVRWPSAPERREMLEEAVAVLRLLWQGGEQSHRGRHYMVDHARVYDVPDPLPPIYVAASGPESAELAGRIGDGLVSVGPNPEVVKAFRAAGGAGKPRYGQVHVCWAPTEAEARRVAHKWWPTSAVPGELSQELPLPRHFEQATQKVTQNDVAETLLCSPDPERHVAKVLELAKAGFDHVYVAQAGPDQEGFFRFYEREVLPRLRRQLDVAA
ncbi:MAG TPA: TIGR03557 family F420-dependent LLM class oxidoreductase [Chloroflexota bacterium]|jgi:G6PDH family F420-dependent oxidoreductase